MFNKNHGLRRVVIAPRTKYHFRARNIYKLLLQFQLFIIMLYWLFHFQTDVVLWISFLFSFLCLYLYKIRFTVLKGYSE